MRYVSPRHTETRWRACRLIRSAYREPWIPIVIAVLEVHSTEGSQRGSLLRPQSFKFLACGEVKIRAWGEPYDNVMDCDGLSVVLAINIVIYDTRRYKSK